MKKLLLALSLLTLAGCGRNSDYVYHSNPPKRQFFNANFSIHEIDSGNKVDILWVIDNSGSMASIQSNIVSNAELFMQEFVKSNYIDWKMGVVSTDKDEKPYLGFDTPFDRTTLDPVGVFKQVVNSLGIDGSPDEYVFHNIDRALNLGPVSFHRPGAHLAVIMVTDEEEQSHNIDRQKYEVNNFYSTIKAMVNPKYKLRVYGAFNAKELEACTDWAMPYFDTPFQKLIQLASGFEMSACVPEFGAGLSNIGKDIASLLEYPRLLLKQRPRVETIKVLYKGTELEPGRPETGGHWYYDDEFNMIVFYNLNFSQDFAFDSVDVSFEVNDGQIR